MLKMQVSSLKNNIVSITIKMSNSLLYEKIKIISKNSIADNSFETWNEINNTAFIKSIEHSHIFNRSLKVIVWYNLWTAYNYEFSCTACKKWHQMDSWTFNWPLLLSDFFSKTSSLKNTELLCFSGRFVLYMLINSHIRTILAKNTSL